MAGAAVLMIAATAVSSYAAFQSGQQQKEQAEAQAAWQEYNAKIGLREAEAEKMAAAFEAQQQRRMGKQVLARQRALVGVSGVEMEGSPLLVAEDTASQLALENANIRLTGQRRVAAYKSQSILDSSMASASRSAASGYNTASYLGLGGSILSGAAQTAYMGSILNNDGGGFGRQLQPDVPVDGWD